MKLAAFLNISLLAFCLLVSCGNDAPKKTTSEKKEVKSNTTAETSNKSSLTATVPKKEGGKSSLTATVPKKSNKSSLSATVPKKDGATPEQLKKAKEIIASISDADIEAIDAKKKFKMLCSTCHGFKGDLNVNGAKDLTISKISLEESVAQVYFGKGLMTPFKGVLTDAEIVAVGKYAETLRN